MATSKLAIWVFAATVALLLAVSPPAAEEPQLHEGGIIEVTAVSG